MACGTVEVFFSEGWAEPAGLAERTRREMTVPEGRAVRVASLAGTWTI